MKIGIFVGSFNPVHKGHIKIVKHLIENKYLDKVIIIPTGNYWNKQNLIDIDDRINMLKFYQNDSIIIDNKLNNLTYTYEIMNELKREYENLYLILGADNLISFDKWNNYEDLLNYYLVIINREDIDVNYYLDKHKIKKYIIVDDLEKDDIYSSLVRDLITSNKSLDKYLDVEIINYIKNNNLYGGINEKNS